MHSWDADHYLTYADERGRPFVELVSRIRAEAPTDVVDLGCGPGNLTRLLAERWPDADVAGVDSSAEMIAAARAGGGAARFDVADLRTWAAAGHRVDVLVSNATLQWVPGHLDLLADLVASVVPGGWLAFQVPGNFGEPSHTIRAELAAVMPAFRRDFEGLRRTSDAAAPALREALRRLDAVDVGLERHLARR